MDVSPLERLVGEVDRFLVDYWARAPLLRVRADGSDAAFDDLASLDDLDRMVASLGLHASNLRMVKDGAPLPPANYTTTPPAKEGAIEARVSPALVYERFSEGATIVLEAMHRYWQPFTDFCRDLEIAFGHRLQVNAYITPPASRGFAVHRDNHDVFVLQISGSKHWIVYDREDQERTLIDQVLRRGDALYIPKGFPHAAATGESASAHLTVGVLTHEGIEVVRAMTKLAEDEPTFRERLPATVARDASSLRETVERYVDEVRVWLDKVDIDEVTETVARRVMSTSQPILRGQLRQLDRLDAIDDDTTLVRRRGATCVLFRKGVVLKVVLADRELEMPLVGETAMEEVARRDRLQVRDLHAFLDPDGAIVLARRLVREGLLEVALAG